MRETWSDSTLTSLANYDELDVLVAVTEIDLELNAAVMLELQDDSKMLSGSGSLASREFGLTAPAEAITPQIILDVIQERSITSGIVGTTSLRPDETEKPWLQSNNFDPTQGVGAQGQGMINKNFAQIHALETRKRAEMAAASKASGSNPVGSPYDLALGY